MREMQSIWQQTVKRRKFPKLEGHQKTDVLIIGGGIAGLLVAHRLREHGVDCLLLEKNRICDGTTAGTTAKITFQHGLCYAELLRSSGVEAARGYLEANRCALAEYERLCAEIPCDFALRDSYVYALTDRGKLEAECAALHAIGYGAAALCDTPTLPMPTVGAVRFPRQAQFHPLRFLYAIAEKLPIYEDSMVRELRGNTAVTAEGAVTAEQIVVATHFPFLNKHGAYFLKLYQHRSYVLALEHAQDVGGMYLDENAAGLSFRNQGDLLLLGGGAHRTGKAGGGWAALEAFAHAHYPKTTVQCRWAAQDCMPLDNRPYIGQYARHTAQLWVATGFHKWGMTGAMLASMLLTDAMLGKENEFASLFCPSRSIWHPQLAVNAWEALTNLLRLTPKRCPHLGCALHWNAAERSWDCACHGSRFAEDGTVLNNPANGDLPSR